MCPYPLQGISIKKKQEQSPDDQIGQHLLLEGSDEEERYIGDPVGQGDYGQAL